MKVKLLLNKNLLYEYYDNKARKVEFYNLKADLTYNVYSISIWDGKLNYLVSDFPLKSF